MINTVLGPVAPEELGVTLMHEHVMVDYIGADRASKSRYEVQEVVRTMLPFLLDLQRAGCTTFVDATPPGQGRDVDVLRECALQSGLKIITCTGTFHGKGVSTQIRAATIEAIVEMWVDEFQNGIEGSAIKPGFIKIALDNGPISPLHWKILRAAARTSLVTGMPIQSHTLLPATMREGAEILLEEGLPLDKFIWTHADSEGDIPAMIELGQKGLWLQVDSIGLLSHGKHIKLLKDLINAGLLQQILLSQDRGWYVVGPDKAKYVNPYHPILAEFIPACRSAGFTEEVLRQMLITNPARVLDIA